MPMDSEINRLGFDAWADNEFVNAIENFPFVATGDIKMENENMTIKVTFTDKTVTCFIRAYTSNGWQTYEKEIKR